MAGVDGLQPEGDRQQTAASTRSKAGGSDKPFESIPDAPVSRFILEMQGGKKGLIVNSTNLCASTNRAKARLTGQNGKTYNSRPVLRVKCKGKGGKKGKRHSTLG